MTIPGKIFLCLVITSFNLGLGFDDSKPRIYYLHVKSDIRYRFATTLVTSKVVNPAYYSQEAKFDVTLPNEAYISAFQMEIDGKIYPGEVKEKIVAQKTYDTAKSRGQSAGHVKQLPRHTNRFNVEVNVAAQDKVTFNLTYQELLQRKRGSYKQVIYVDPKQIVPELTIDIAIEESRDIKDIRVPPLRNDLEQAPDVIGQNSLAVIEKPTTRSARIFYSPTEADQRLKSYQGISGQFVVEYDIDRKFDVGDVLVVNGYFVHFFAPSDKEEIPKDVLMILDVSGSMQGRKIDQMKEAVLVILDDLHEGDRFNILTFNNGVDFFRHEFVVASRHFVARAKNYVRSKGANGGTNIDMAIRRGLEFLRQAENVYERSQVVLFLTDGEPTSGVTDINQILSNVRRANSHACPIYSLAFGQTADYEFVKKVAIQNNGLSRKIYEDSDATLQITGFYDEFSAALLKDLSFQYLRSSSDVQDLTITTFPSYFVGSEIVVAGKLGDNTLSSLDILVKGLGSEGFVELALSVYPNESPFPGIMKPGNYEEITEKIWAYLTIKQLLEKSIGETNSWAKEDKRRRALDLSLKYKFVTPLTSMVVTKPEKKEVGDLEEGEDADLTRQDLQDGWGGRGRNGGLIKVHSIPQVPTPPQRVPQGPVYNIPPQRVPQGPVYNIPSQRVPQGPVYYDPIQGHPQNPVLATPPQRIPPDPFPPRQKFPQAPVHVGTPYYNPREKAGKGGTGITQDLRNAITSLQDPRSWWPGAERSLGETGHKLSKSAIVLCLVITLLVFSLHNY